EDRAMLLRGIRLGRARDGVIPIHGALLPEVAAQFQRICDPTQAPRVAFADTIAGEDPIPDARTWPQRHHDALATALSVAASSRLLPTIGGSVPAAVRSLPTIGGAAPTLVISVRAEDLTAGTGWAHVDGVDEPISPAAA